MKVLIISDTHGREEKLEDVLLDEGPIDYLIHCGDIEGQEILIEALADCPCSMIAGNNDFFSDLQDEVLIELRGKRIWITHGHCYGVHTDTSILLDRAKQKQCDIVCFGHVHYPVLEKREGVLIINPGSLSYPRQRGRQATYAVMELKDRQEPQVRIEYI